jgi:hypothetical protein
LGSIEDNVIWEDFSLTELYTQYTQYTLPTHRAKPLLPRVFLSLPFFVMTPEHLALRRSARLVQEDDTKNLPDGKYLVAILYHNLKPEMIGHSTDLIWIKGHSVSQQSEPQSSAIVTTLLTCHP